MKEIVLYSWEKNPWVKEGADLPALVSRSYCRSPKALETILNKSAERKDSSKDREECERVLSRLIPGTTTRGQGAKEPGIGIQFPTPPRYYDQYMPQSSGGDESGDLFIYGTTEPTTIIVYDSVSDAASTKSQVITLIEDVPLDWAKK